MLDYCTAGAPSSSGNTAILHCGAAQHLRQAIDCDHSQANSIIHVSQKKQKKTFDTMKTGTGICAATPKLKQRHVLRRTIYITEQRPRCVSLLHGWGWGNVARAPRALYHPICPPINPYHAHLVSASSASSAVAPAAVCTSRTAPSASFSRAQRLASGLSVCGWGVSALSCACAVDHRDRAIHTTQRTGWTRISGHKGQGGRVLVSKQPATE